MTLISLSGWFGDIAPEHGPILFRIAIAVGIAGLGFPLLSVICRRLSKPDENDAGDMDDRNPVPVYRRGGAGVVWYVGLSLILIALLIDLEPIMTAAYIKLTDYSGGLKQEERFALYMKLIKAVIVLCVGYPILIIFTRGIRRGIEKNISVKTARLVTRIIRYIGMLLLLIMILNELGFSLKALLGTLGVAGLAIGFASQNAVSNIISGIFLLIDRPFGVGDIVKLGGTVGKVDSIDLLAIKIKAFDNQYIRIPNSRFISADVSNYTQFETLRMEVTINIALNENSDTVQDRLMALAADCDGCLTDPAPVVTVMKSTDTALDLTFTLWARREDYNALRSHIAWDIHRMLKEAGVTSTCTMTSNLEV